MERNSLIPRLLSGRDRLGRVEKDAVLERVLDATASPARAPRRVAALFLAGVAAAAGVFLMVRGGGDKVQERFASRGAARETAALRVSCGGDATCAPGDEMVLDLTGTRGYRYLALFSRRADGTVIWYLPETDAGTSIDLAEHLERGVLDRKVLLDAQHPPGRYTLHAVYSTGPLTREAIRTRFEPGKRDIGGTSAVVEKELVLR